MLKDSSAVNVDQLDESKAYIQITYVEPYFHDYEDQKRTTYFERFVLLPSKFKFLSTLSLRRRY